MICSDCRVKYHWKGADFIEKHYCMRCYEEFLPLEQVDLIYAQQICALEKELLSLKSRKANLFSKSSASAAPSTPSLSAVDTEDHRDSDCRQQ